MGFLPWEIRDTFPRGSQLWQSRATQRSVHARCSSVSIIHRTSGMDYRIFNACTGVNVCDCTRGVRTHVRASALKVDSGRKIPRRTEESNLRQRRDGLMLKSTELHPHQIIFLCFLLYFFFVTDSQTNLRLVVFFTHNEEAQIIYMIKQGKEKEVRNRKPWCFFVFFFWWW